MSIFRRLKLNKRTIIKRLLPSQPCLLCGDANLHGICCQNCDGILPYYTQSRCPICALPTINHEVCGACLKHPPAFHHTCCVFRYQAPADFLIQAFKYRQQLALAPYFAAQLQQHIHSCPDRIIAMPLHPQKLRQRGFNQAQLLAQQLSRRLGIPLDSNSCQRVRNTESQAALPWAERQQNVKNAFHCDADLSGQHIAIVDDVMTTGASLHALALALAEQGASRIEAWVIARTLPAHSENS